MNTLLTTAFEGNQNIRVLGTFDQPLFVTKDLGEALGLSNIREALSNLHPDDLADVSITDTSSNGTTQRRNVKAVNESGLYQLIFQSRKPEAKKFCRWVTSEVLPQLRRQGFYLITGGEPTAFAEVRELEYRMQAAQLRGEAELLERRARLSVEIPEGIAINIYLIEHYPDLDHKRRANTTRAVKRAITKQLKRPVGVIRGNGGNKQVAAAKADILAALELIKDQSLPLA